MFSKDYFETAVNRFNKKCPKQSFYSVRLATLIYRKFSCDSASYMLNGGRINPTALRQAKIAYNFWPF